ncbi:MAG TPA: UPF0236 family protein [Blastocatellia bacterium]|nr:UPF0236 family protein [Blastocatellia bacterium]
MYAQSAGFSTEIFGSPLLGVQLKVRLRHNEKLNDHLLLAGGLQCPLPTRPSFFNVCNATLNSKPSLTPSLMLSRTPLAMPRKPMKPNSVSSRNSASWANKPFSLGPSANNNALKPTAMPAQTWRARKKKLHWRTRFGLIQIQEQIYRWRCTRKLLRPFSAAAAVRCRGYSLGLQRVLTDFGADHSFAQAIAKVKEHYLIEVPTSAARQHTNKHAAQMKEATPASASLPEGGVAQVVAQTDGCLIPIVKIAAKGPKDRRKRRQLDWQEARLSLAYRAGSLEKHYQATLQAVEVAGAQLLECARRAGAGQKSRIHCVGDGAGWIVRQVEDRFGGQGSYLIDFYHVSEYLAKAAEAISRAPQAWRRRQQQRLKSNRVGKVLEELTAHLEEEVVEDEPAPVRACWRYLSNRLGNLDYKGALAAGLPIGSGEIESGNRSVIQARLKRSGAWWKEENAEDMLALRTLRASGQWESYWNDLRQAAA